MTPAYPQAALEALALSRNRSWAIALVSAHIPQQSKGLNLLSPKVTLRFQINLVVNNEQTSSDIETI